MPKDRDAGQLPPSAPEGKPWCSTVKYVSSRKTMSGILDGVGVTTEELAPWLYTEGMRVIDKTGVQGRFDFHLEFSRDGGPPAEDPDPSHAAPPITSAVEQLGLKMTRAKGPVEFLVIDHVERPSGN